MTNEDKPNEETAEPSFEKVDKRHSAEEEATDEEIVEQAAEPTEGEAPESAQEEVVEETAEAEEAGPPEGTSLAELSVYDTLRFMGNLLMEQAWINLGIHVAPGTGDLKEDLVQARVAIDTLEVVVEKLQPELSESERSELSTVLANLRLNYVKKAE